MTTRQEYGGGEDDDKGGDDSRWLWGKNVMVVKMTTISKAMTADD